MRVKCVPLLFSNYSNLMNYSQDLNFILYQQTRTVRPVLSLNCVITDGGEMMLNWNLYDVLSSLPPSLCLGINKWQLTFIGNPSGFHQFFLSEPSFFQSLVSFPFLSSYRTKEGVIEPPYKDRQMTTEFRPVTVRLHRDGFPLLPRVI